MARVSADLFSATLGKASIRDGAIDAALALSEWPRDPDLLIVDLGGADDPVADAAALKTAVPGGCIVIGVGRINDVAFYRDLVAVGFNDYLAMPFAEGAMGRAVERALELRDRTGGTPAANQGAQKTAKPRTLSVIGVRGGVGTTTTAVTIAAMLGTRLAEEVLLVDFDLHYGSLMLALDLEAIDAVREALDQPDRIDALFIQQVAQKKNEYLYAMGAEEAPSGGFQARPHAAVPITAGPTVPIVKIGDATLRAVPGKRWQIVLYLDNNSAGTVVPVINCRFTNAGKLVEQTHVLVPAIGAGLRVGMTVHGPKTDLFVDRATCSVTSP